LYWMPAEKFFNQNGFTLPLSMLTIYDSYIHSGSVLNSLRAQFPDLVPVSGGDEKTWILKYLDARQAWLANHSNVIVQRTTYRTRAMLMAAQENNWLLDKDYKVNGHIVK
jgi:chitosanase